MTHTHTTHTHHTYHTHTTHTPHTHTHTHTHTHPVLCHCCRQERISCLVLYPPYPTLSLLTKAVTAVDLAHIGEKMLPSRPFLAVLGNLQHTLPLEEVHGEVSSLLYTYIYNYYELLYSCGSSSCQRLLSQELAYWPQKVACI